MAKPQQTGYNIGIMNILEIKRNTVKHYWTQYSKNSLRLYSSLYKIVFSLGDSMCEILLLISTSNCKAYELLYIYHIHFYMHVYSIKKPKHVSVQGWSFLVVLFWSFMIALILHESFIFIIKMKSNSAPSQRALVHIDPSKASYLKERVKKFDEQFSL